MSKENIEIVRRIYAGLSDNFKPPRELYGPDYEFDAREIAPDIGVVRGYDAALEAVHMFWDTMEDFRYEVEDVIHADERSVVTSILTSARMKGSDTEISHRYFHVFVLAGGKVVRFSAHTDKGRALEAAGRRD